MVEEEHFQEVWATMEAGKIVWYRDEKRTEVDYTADLAECKVVCAYDATREGPGGGRLPVWPEPDPEPEEPEEGEEPAEKKEPEEVIPPLNLRFTFFVEIDSVRNPPVPRLLNSRQTIKGLMLDAPGTRPSSVASNRSRPSTAMTGSRPNTTADGEKRPVSDSDSKAPSSKKGGKGKDKDETAEDNAEPEPEPPPPPFYDQIGEPPPDSRYSLAITIDPEDKITEFEQAIASMDS